jgi:hypothetical protein
MDELRARCAGTDGARARFEATGRQAPGWACNDPLARVVGEMTTRALASSCHLADRAPSVDDVERASAVGLAPIGLDEVLVEDVLDEHAAYEHAQCCAAGEAFEAERELVHAPELRQSERAQRARAARTTAPSDVARTASFKGSSDGVGCGTAKRACNNGGRARSSDSTHVVASHVGAQGGARVARVRSARAARAPWRAPRRARIGRAVRNRVRGGAVLAGQRAARCPNSVARAERGIDRACARSSPFRCAGFGGASGDDRPFRS